MRPLSSNLVDEDKRPYFLWDEDISLREFKERLRGPDAADRLQMLAKLLREARDTDVWMFITPQEAAEALPPSLTKARAAAGLLGLSHRRLQAPWRHRPIG